MKQKYMKYIFIIAISLLFFIPNKTFASTSDYTIQNYNIDMVVNENNTFDITETITAYFNVSKHGIYRKLPLKNTVTRTDGTTSKNTAKISNVSVSEEYTTSKSNGYYVIQIGSSSTTLTGSHTYTIKYTYDIGKDPLKDADELYYNLIGDEWDTSISNISFKITMPKSFDSSTLGFSSGATGSTNSSNISYYVNGNVINGIVYKTLGAGEGFTVRLTLPEDYYVGASSHIDVFSIFVIILCAIFVLITDRLWSKYGKDEQVVETVEFYPPEGYNSAEVNFLYNGSVETKGIISLLIYLANKGYLTIEETEEKGLFSKSKGFKITKIKEYDGDNEYERIFFNGLFKAKPNGYANIEKAKEIVKEAKAQGEKIKFKDALEMSMVNSSNGKESVTASDLYDSFYTTLNRIEIKINSKENKNKIFESTAKGKGRYIILMIIAIFILITAKPVIGYYGILATTMLPIGLIFPGVGFYVMLIMLFGKTRTIYTNGKPSNSSLGTKSFGLIWGLRIWWFALVYLCTTSINRK